MITVTIARYQDGRSWRSTHEVDAAPSNTVLDVLFDVQQQLDESLSFRYSCRNWMCGSCGMLVNGKERLACKTRLGDLGTTQLVVEPLRNLPVLKDLVVDLAPFFEKWTAIGLAANEHPDAPARPGVRAEIDAHLDCITCGLCYSACAVVEKVADFYGPAALNRAYTLQLDPRDGAHAARADAVAGDGGAFRCHLVGACTDVCPKGLDPIAAISGLKRSTGLR